MHIVVVGAGAAGCMAAIHAAEELRRRSRSGDVLLLERTRDGGRKILISGGGRCNILPSELDPSRFVTDSSPNTLRNILRSWPLADQVRFFDDRLGLALIREDETGKLFPRSNKARDVRDGLLAEVRRAGATVEFGATVTGVVPEGEGWRVALENRAIDADVVILATGGLSVPATGSDGTGLRIAEALGHEMHETYPALTPLTTNHAAHMALAGLSGRVTLRAVTSQRRWTTTGGFLFTHRGYSGPTVLDLSHLAVRSPRGAGAQVISAQWTALDADDWHARLRDGGTAHVGTLLKRELPERLAELILQEASVDADTSAAQLRREDRIRLVEMLTAMPLRWSGDEGYKKAEVTGGGVALGEIDPRTMESRRAPGLFLCGEMLDAFGPIGGYNFLLAWATGRAAGIGAASRPAV